MDTAGDRGLGETFAGVLDPPTESQHIIAELLEQHASERLAETTVSGRVHFTLGLSE